MITAFDYLSIAFYFTFVVTVGVVFSRRNKNTSDYFRGGGIMPWWMAGASAWMASFSAWTFTGAAGKIFTQGFYVLLLYYSSLVPLLALLFFTCYRFRRMRVVTPLEAIRMRYGAGTQQFVTWLRLPFLLLFGGVGLNTVGVFMSGAFNVPLPTVIVILGVLVTFVSLVGGAFGVAASDFVQMFLVVTITLVISALALAQPQVGGFHGLWQKLPSRDFHWGEFARPEFITLWFLALLLNNLFGNNTMVLIFPLFGTLIGPLMWMLPPLVASAIYTPGQIHNVFPNLGRHPEEGAFLLTAHDVLPKGMLGLLVSGIFGATLSNLDASVNQGVGILVRNFYLPVINPQCPEKRLLILSKGATAIFGVIIIGIGLIVSEWRTASLFDFLNQLGVSLWLPLAIPMCLGLFYKRTPPWSSWTTVLIGLSMSCVMKFCTRPQMFNWIPGLHGPFTPEEATQYYLFATVGGVSIVCIAWFFFTSRFYESSSPQYKATVEAFFARLKTPVEDLTDAQAKENHKVVAAIGRLCMIFGAFVLLLMLVPNEAVKRLAFLFCGGMIFIVGWLLQHVSSRKQAATARQTAEAVSSK
ncbi:MAG: hypothetical protein ABSH08_14740 [Tepidisphaeraceae bacterium]